MNDEHHRDYSINDCIQLKVAQGHPEEMYFAQISRIQDHPNPNEPAVNDPAASLITSDIDRCFHPLSCACSRRAAGHRIDASNNAVGPAIGSHVPAALLTLPSTPNLNFGYCAANKDNEPLGMAFRQAVAKAEGVKTADVCITGSLLELFERLPRVLGRHSIIKLMGDFVGYGRGAAHDIPLIEIPVLIDADAVDPGTVGNTVRGKEDPMVFLTFPTTNPLQQRVSLDVAKAVLSSNPNAIVVIDNAYGAFGDIRDLASFALSNERTIYV